MNYRNIALLAVCQAVLMTGSSLLIATSALVGAALADSAVWATIPLGVQFLAMTATTVPASLLMQRYGRRTGFLLGIVAGLIGIGLAVTAILGADFLLFSIASLFVGIFNGIGQFFRFAAADVAGEGNKARAISLVLAGGIVAGFLGPNIGSWTESLLDVRFAASYLALGVFYLVGLVAISLLRIPPPKQAGAADGARPLTSIVSQPHFIVAVLTAAIGYGVMNIIMVATPLAMDSHQFGFSDTAFVIQWHVVAMFLPSFFTGELIRRLGVMPIIQSGVALMFGCVVINFLGVSIWHHWSALVLLGVGWNFMFIGGTTMLTQVHSEAEKGKTQALNDFIVFGTVSVTALGSGALLDLIGWLSLNVMTVPFLILVALAVSYLQAVTKRVPQHTAGQA